MWMIVCFWIYSSRVKGEQLCPEPDPVLNAYRYSDEQFLMVGGWLNYTCYINYILISGSLNRQCQPDGIFSNSPPVCLYSCGPPPNITDMQMEVPELILDGSITRYTCIRNSSITFQAVCRRDLNTWLYNYTVCPFPGNIYQVVRHDTNSKFLLNAIETVTDGNPDTCVRRQIDTHLNIWFNNNVDTISFNITLGTIYAENLTVGLGQVSKTYTDIKSREVIHMEFPPDVEVSYGNKIAIKGRANLSICEIYIKGNNRNESCNGPLVFKHGTEVYLDSGQPRFRCLPGFYHHSSIENLICDYSTLNWKKTMIVCSPVDNLIRIEASNPSQEVLFDLQDDTCYNLSKETDTIRGISSSSGNNMFITAISLKFENGEERKAFGEPVFKVDDVHVLVRGGCKHKADNASTLVCNFNPPTKGREIEMIHNASVTISLCEVHVLGQINEPQAYECFPRHPFLYQGKMNHTIFGHACERWDGVPASYQMTFDYLPDPSATGAENYCRDPSRNHSRPWCFINNYTEEQPCPVLDCDHCSKQKHGQDYEGQLSVTSMGTNCTDWSSMDSNRSVEDNKKFNKYCRNPGNGYSTPWCFTDVDGTFERCETIKCPRELRYIQYNYKKDFTSHLWFPKCYWFSGTKYFRRYRVNITERWFRRRYLQNSPRLYCFGSEDLILTEFHLESYDLNTTEPTTASTTLTATDVTTEPTTASTSLAATDVTTEPTTASSSLTATDVTTEPMTAPTTLTATDVTTEPTTASTSLAATDATTEPTIASTTLTATDVTTSIEVTTSVNKTTAKTEPKTTATFSTTKISTAEDSKTSPFVPATTTTNQKSVTSGGQIYNGNTSSWTVNPENPCYCQCNMEPSLLTNESMEERIAQIHKKLHIEKQKLTSTVRKLTSAYDARPSATYLGSSALALFICVMLLIVLPDVFTLIYHVYIVLNHRFKGPSDQLIRL